MSNYPVCRASVKDYHKRLEAIKKMRLQDLSVSVIALRLGVCHDTINKALRKLGMSYPRGGRRI